MEPQRVASRVRVRAFRDAVLLLLLSLPVACGRPGPKEPPLTVVAPLHLEEHLAAAAIQGSEAPDDVPAPVEWRFDRSQPAWKPATPLARGWDPVAPHVVGDALRIPLNESHRSPFGRLDGTVYVELPGWQIEDWGYVEVEVRTADRMQAVGLEFNFSERDPHLANGLPFYSSGDRAPLITDGTIQTYRLSLGSSRMRRWEGPWTHLAIWFTSQSEERSASVDLLSVRVVPVEAEFATDRAGVRLLGRAQTSARTLQRRSIFMHAPGRVAYRVRVPDQGRLDLGLGVLRANAPVTFGVTAAGDDGVVETLLEETHSDPRRWVQRSVDLSLLAGRTVVLTLEAEAERPGEVALWAAPTVSGAARVGRPNVIFYIIDGAGADYMSVYGYNRRTTPNLERLAAQGAVFERAYSNSSWTRPSTPSFLTSLHHSVLGGLRNGRNPVPDQVLTIAEHLHRGGYQTAMFTSNPNAGSMSGLDRGLDVFREAGVRPNSISSVELHDDFWAWRDAYPGQPYWAHFQTTDVHNNHTPVPPFAGLFISPERRRRADRWLERVEAIPETDDVRVIEAVEQIGVDQVEYWTAQRDLHDETMAHQDHQLGRLVERLRASGEWARTLLVVAGDHAVAAGSWDYNLLMREPQPPHVFHDDRGTPMLRSGVTRIPMILVWPQRIAPGQRFGQPVSMIDMLPTILDLAGLPGPELTQGQSLAPLLLGKPGWEPRPVILDEFELNEDTSELSGRIEVIDGRWGASLEINPDPKRPRFGCRPTPLLVYDLWEDPDCLHSLHEERPDLVEKYTDFLQARWAAHQALGQRFSRPEDPALTPEQLETLRALGYVQ